MPFTVFRQAKAENTSSSSSEAETSDDDSYKSGDDEDDVVDDGEDADDDVLDDVGDVVDAEDENDAEDLPPFKTSKENDVELVVPPFRTPQPKLKRGTDIVSGQDGALFKTPVFMPRKNTKIGLLQDQTPMLSPSMPVCKGTVFKKSIKYLGLYSLTDAGAG